MNKVNRRRRGGGRWVALIVGAVLMRVSLAGGIPVFDAGQIAESVKHTANQLKALDNQLKLLTDTRTQLDEMVRNSSLAQVAWFFNEANGMMASYLSIQQSFAKLREGPGGWTN